MNRIHAVITDIQSVDTLNLVHFNAAEQNMKMIALELDKRLVVGSKVIIGAKATHIALAKEFCGMLSMSNQLHVKIEQIENGALLSRVQFVFAGARLESIVTKDSALAMQLKVGDDITALIKSSELSILEVL
jgi:molybdate transport system regulatory protein